MAKIFINQIMDKVLNATLSDKQIENAARKLSLVRMRQEKSNLLNSLNRHDVTEELDAGPDATSVFLSRGNLFSFI